jgi:N-acetylmuramoyl-L-alanine amidase
MLLLQKLIIITMYNNKVLLLQLWLLPMLFFFSSQNIQAQNYKEVSPKAGDGIFSLLRAYNLDPKDYFDAFIELNKDKLGDDLILKTGLSYRLPVVDESNSATSRESGVFPIFGKDYEKVTFKDNTLQGAIFYIVPGHGGPDPGAVGEKAGHTLCEDEYAYDIALRLARNLLEHNATVYVITRDDNDGIRDEVYLKCDKDEYCWGDQVIPINQTRRLRQRANAINELSKKYGGQYQRTIELHVDSRYEKQNVDIFFYHHPKSTKGKALNKTLYATIKAKYDEVQPGRGYKGSISGRNLYMLRHANPVSTYIELGNINHQRDQKRLLRTDNRQAIANWLMSGLIKDYENSK